MGVPSLSIIQPSALGLICWSVEADLKYFHSRTAGSYLGRFSSEACTRTDN